MIFSQLLTDDHINTNDDNFLLSNGSFPLEEMFKFFYAISKCTAIINPFDEKLILQHVRHPPA
jgi:hypothetical protein